MPVYKDYEGMALVNEDDEILAAVMFHGYVKDLSMVLQIAGEHWTPTFMAAVCHYCFIEHKCRRVSGFIDVSNTKSRAWAEAFGAKLEGVMREASPRGDVCVYGLLRADAAKWLTPRMLRKLDKERIPA